MLLEAYHERFGTSSLGPEKFKKRLQKIMTVGPWETFLHTAGSNIGLRQRDGIPIRIQPTFLAVRSAQVTRGSKCLPSG
jgi:hypothetical protein